MVIKNAEITYNIKWLILEKVNEKTKIDRYPLCLTEKLHLTEYFEYIRLLNKRSEPINHCRQQNKLLVRNLRRNDSMD